MARLLLCAGLLAAGCTSIELSDKFPCQSDAECDVDFICVTGHCELAHICNTGGAVTPCPSGQECIGNFCKNPPGSTGNPDGGPAADAGTGCVPKSCALLGAVCGSPDDGCGHALSCGSCGAPAADGGPGGTDGGATGSASVCDQTFHCCARKPQASACAGLSCGGVSDGCGGSYDCGSCPANTHCGGAGAGATSCGCTPLTCQPGFCGSMPDGCGSTLNCGNTCAAGTSCGGGGVQTACGSDFPLSNSFGWRWESPRPLSNPLYAAWFAPGGAEGWVGGSAGTLMHWQNGAFTPLWGTIVDITVSLFGFSPSDVHASSGSALWRYTGSSWTSVASTTDRIEAIHGASSTDVWGVGDRGLIEHWNGSSWVVSRASAAGQPHLHGVWASGALDAWAVGEGGTVLHWNGSWQAAAVTGVSNQTLNTVWGSGGGDVWIGGDGVLSHWNGSAWTSFASQVPAGSISAIRGTGSQDVWLGGVTNGATLLAHWDGSKWFVHSRYIGANNRVLAISANSVSDVWFTGESGMLVHWNGSVFSGNVLSPPGKPTGTTKIWGSGPGDVWFSAREAPGARFDQGQGLYHYDGHDYVWAPFPVADTIVAGGSFARNKSVAVANTTDASNQPQAVLVGWDGQRWAVALTAPGVAATAGWADSMLDGWMAVQGTNGAISMVHVVSGVGQSVPVPAGTPALTGMWGTRADDIWAVGGSTALHYDGSAWSRVNTGLANPSFTAIHGAAANDFWVVGGSAIYRSTGGVWTQANAAVQAGTQFTDVFATSQNDVWLASPSGYIRYFNGAFTTNSYPNFQSVWASSATDLWGGMPNDWSDEFHWNGSLFDFSLTRRFPGNGGFSFATELMHGFLFAAFPADKRTYTYFTNAGLSGWAPHSSYGNESPIAVWGTYWSDVFAVTQEGSIFHDTAGPQRKELTTTAGAIAAIWGPAGPNSNPQGTTPATDVWAAGPSGCWRSNGGGTWSAVTPCAGVAIHGSSPSDVWMVGGSTATHWNGGGYQQFPLPTGMVAEGVWSASPTLAFAVGHDASGNGVVAQWAGSAWATVHSTPGRTLHRVWGLSGTDVWAAGNLVLSHLGSGSWTDNVDNDANFIGLSGLSSTDAFAVGSNGVVLRPNGTLP